jgi:flagellar hook assembly protein FlgD
VHLNIYNLQGQHVKTLFSGWRNGGEYRETWWGKDSQGKIVTQGIYFVVFETETMRDIRRIVFIK